MESFRVKLGGKYRDKNSGLIGIAIVRAEYLFGSTRVGIQASVGTDNRPVAEVWFEEQALEEVLNEQI